MAWFIDNKEFNPVTECRPDDRGIFLPLVHEDSSAIFEGATIRSHHYHDETIMGTSCTWNLPHCWLQKIYSTEWIGKYLHFLDECPAITKSITAGVIGGVGDILAQLGEWAVLNKLQRPKGASDGQLFRLDVHRAFTIAAEGLLVSGPLLHFAYEWLDEIFSVLGNEHDSFSPHKFLTTMAQVLIDLVVMDSFFVATLMVTSAFLQGRRCHQVWHELRNEYISAVKVSWLSSLSMAPLSFLNFGYIPVQFRVLVTNFQDVVWNAAVS